VVGRSHPWFHRARICVRELTKTDWVMRESGSGTQQILEHTLQKWGIDIKELNVMLVLSSSEMVKAVVESGVGAAAIPELMVQKELQLSTLRAVEITNSRKGSGPILEIVQPVWKLKHGERFQTQLAIAFEQMLMI
jgi:DNA-binding transcriptional LysR family regulator